MAVIGTMRLIMDDRQVSTIEEVKRFLEGSHGVEFRAETFAKVSKMPGDQCYIV